jgi:hypothetical protein
MLAIRIMGILARMESAAKIPSARLSSGTMENPAERAPRTLRTRAGFPLIRISPWYSSMPYSARATSVFLAPTRP